MGKSSDRNKMPQTLNRMNQLRKGLEDAFTELEIDENQQESLSTHLYLLKQRDIPTYKHCIRVGLKGKDVAEYTHIVEPKALFYAGLLHDFGKLAVDPKSLKKKKGFNERDMQELMKHPIEGYRMLKDIHEFSARVLLYHHWFQENGYPKQIPKSDVKFSKGTEASIMYYARVLALIDSHDAATFRKNNKFSGDVGRLRLPTREEVKQIMLERNPDQKYLVNELYSGGIF